MTFLVMIIVICRQCVDVLVKMNSFLAVGDFVNIYNN